MKSFFLTRFYKKTNIHLMKTTSQNIESLVESYFSGRTDKVGIPYIEHCRKVANMAKNIAEKNFPDKSNACYLVGLLHDVIEDCEHGEEFVSQFSEDIFYSVKLLTRTKDLSYNKYFKTILKSDDIIAIIVKYCDSCHNSDITRYPKNERTEKIRFRCQRYRDRVLILAKKIIKLKEQHYGK